MTIGPEKLESYESPEERAAAELLDLGLACVPENIKAVMEQQKTLQHPEGFDDITKSDSLKEIGKAMREKRIKDVIHIEDPSLWIHCKLAMKLVDFLPIEPEKKADLKLIMLYHDLGKVRLEDTPEIKHIQEKELKKGKLYKVAKGHAFQRAEDIEAGLRANGIDGHQLEIFMKVVKNHMESSLAEMTGPKLVELFEDFGKDDEERKEVAEMLAWAIQVDGNACLHVKSGDNGEAMVEFKDNKTGLDFDKIWTRYQAAKKAPRF